MHIEAIKKKKRGTFKHTYYHCGFVKKIFQLLMNLSVPRFIFRGNTTDCFFVYPSICSWTWMVHHSSSHTGTIGMYIIIYSVSSVIKLHKAHQVPRMIWTRDYRPCWYIWALTGEKELEAQRWGRQSWEWDLSSCLLLVVEMDIELRKLCVARTHRRK